MVVRVRLFSSPKPDYFTYREDRLLELYRQLENFILKDITRRLLSAGEMTATADRLTHRRRIALHSCRHSQISFIKHIDKVDLSLLSAGEMTATADRLIWKLKQMGESQAAIEQKLRKLTGLTQKELRSLLQDAVLTSWEDDRATLGRLDIELSNPLKNAAVIRGLSYRVIPASPYEKKTSAVLCFQFLH